MLPLLSCQSIRKSFATRVLFKEISFSIFPDQRIGLIGPNGSGKTTFLKILAGIEDPEEGIVTARKDLKLGYVPQGCDFPNETIEQILISAQKRDIPEYEKQLQAEIWMSKLGFEDPKILAPSLSGGWKKRLGFGSALIDSPDLLLLDEPTNHLDLEGIYWLEKFLLRESPTFLLVSHDRYFLQNVVNRVAEIDPVYPKGMFAIDGPYLEFLMLKEQFLLGQLEQERSQATKARRETEWLRQGVKARTTKSQSRIDAAGEILQEYAELKTRNQQRKAKIDFASSERETQKLLSAKNLAKSIGGRFLFRHLDFTLSPKTRIGLMGPNGSGKTTLLKVLAGELQPDQGTLKRADDLKIVYFDQHRAALASHISLRDALSPQGEYVEFQGSRIHVNGWCKRFLFSPDLLDLPIEKLSGGERARISIAHLMLQPADLLLLDEPTNDLDIATLETLEESLLEFPGALVLITHDRCMLDRICNQFLALGDAETPVIYAEYEQWKAANEHKTAPELAKKEKGEVSARPKGRLSYMEKKEYEEIEGKIAKLEKEISDLNVLLEVDAIAQNAQKLADVCQAIGVAQNQIEQLFVRWDWLEQKLKGSN